ncbi:hypothetical protein BHE74_00051343 [Ensete ventricosum]|nr:hypothetical protein BHE74_00051343 [Ensete ventricosum]
MRLNHVESFYAFLLHFCSEGSEEEGQPATTSPHAWSATHGQAMAKASLQGRSAPLAGVAACKGGRHRSQGQQPTREVGVASRGSACEHSWLRLARRGGSCPRAHPLAAQRPQGVAASRGDDASRRGGRPLAG